MKIQELPKAHYQKINAIVHRDFLSVQCQTVINMTNPGFILVDNIEEPKTAIVFHQGEAGFYFIGNPNNDEFNNEILPYIKSTLKLKLATMNIESFDFSGDNKIWNTKFEYLFKETNLWVSEQRIYLSKIESVSVIENKPNDYLIEEITQELIDDDTIENLKFITDEVYEFWKDWNSFALFGGGLYIKKNNQIIAKCVADGIAFEMIAVRIETLDSYKRKGIATNIATEFIKWANVKDKKIYWECAGENVGSIKVAEKIGLSLHQVYNLYGFTI